MYLYAQFSELREGEKLLQQQRSSCAVHTAVHHLATQFESNASLFINVVGGEMIWRSLMIKKRDGLANISLTEVKKDKFFIPIYGELKVNFKSELGKNNGQFLGLHLNN